MTRHGIIAIMFCALLSTCDQSDAATKPTKETELIKAETALMSDPERAGPGLENRLAQRVRVDSGLVLV